MFEVSDVVVCEGCDAVWRKPQLRPREVAHCPRCATELARHPGAQRQRILPLTVASLILFAIANLFPIVEIELRGLRSQTTLLGAVIALAKEGMSEVALLVLATTLAFPLLQLCILLYLLVPLARTRRPPGFSTLVRAMQSLRPWGMIEVFLLGVLVAIVKLSSMASVVPGTALWAFVGLTVLLTSVLSFDPRTFWEVAFESANVEAPGAGPTSASGHGA
ncbi:MAG: paraquat-inducible protein [Variovorax sp.]|nr:paraquat-inducible protein [Variovorax sp.]